MSREKKVIIVGAGIAGLSAGCYLQMNGYTTEIFEAGKKAGGLCTAWKRKGYTFDGCVNWLTGSNPMDPFFKIWRELGVAKNTRFIDFDEYARIDTLDGKYVPVHTNIDRLEEELIRLAPEDRQSVREFAATVRKLSGFVMPADKARELYSPFDYVKYFVRYAPFLTLFGQWRNVTVREYARRFKSPVLKDMFPALIGIDTVSVLVLMLMLSWFNKKSAGYPLGGSQAMAEAVEKRYLGLGGKIYYSSKVLSVTVNNNRACGVELEKGGTYAADTVVSAADGNATIFKMLKGEFADKFLVDAYNTLDLFPAILQVSLGVGRSFAGVPHTINMLLDRALTVDDKIKTERITAHVYHFDPALAPEGKTPLTIIVPADYEYWVNLRNNHARKYLIEKERLAGEVIGILEKRLGDVAAKVEVYDVATPATYQRYTGNWRGSFEGWLPTPRGLKVSFRKTLPGLSHFYMAGQWVEPGGGLPAVALSGRNAAQLICKKDGKRFRVPAE